jgi:hypothetical protein
MHLMYMKFKNGLINNKTMTEDELYSAIEAAIIRWNLDGTKTAGSLTREIMLLIKQQSNG